MTFTVFLDLDGCLTESAPGIASSIGHALAVMGATVPPTAELATLVDPPLRDSFLSLGVPAARVEEAVDAYRERYTTIDMYEARVYDGIAGMMERLRDAGAMLCLATAKPIAYAAKITAHFDLAPMMTHQFGDTLDGRYHDKRLLLAHAMEVSGADPATSFMLGDRHGDMDGAAHHGITAIGALWGYGSAEELNVAGADVLASHPREVAEFVLDRRSR